MEIGFISEFENLPEYLQKQVMDYIEFLKHKNKENNKNKKKFSFDWENELSDFKNNYTSVELQHKANELRRKTYLQIQIYFLKFFWNKKTISKLLQWIKILEE